MRSILTVIVLAVSLSGHTQEELLTQDAITRPVLSLRCKELFKERAQKVKVQQKLNSLLQRNDDLLKKTPEKKETLTAKLSATRVKVRNELYLATLQIESMEENIVRSGCPGLSLE